MSVPRQEARFAGDATVTERSTRDGRHVTREGAPRAGRGGSLTDLCYFVICFYIYFLVFCVEQTMRRCRR